MQTPIAAPAAVSIVRRCTYLIHPTVTTPEHPHPIAVETDELLTVIPGMCWVLSVSAVDAPETATFEGGPHTDPYVHAQELAAFLADCANALAAGRQAA